MDYSNEANSPLAFSSLVANGKYFDWHLGRFTLAGSRVYALGLDECRQNNLRHLCFCHQLPQRSFFLFGEQTMYSLKVIQSAWQDTANPLVLRQFIGNPEMGWKVAWSDRMIGMYTSIWFASQLYGLVWKRVKPISIWSFALLSLPLVIDGGTHMLSDFVGIGHGFRDTNIWLQAITGNMFSQSFYAGDALGSFNSWMRLITGLLFGLALVWLAFPPINDSFDDTARRSEATLAKAVDS